MSSRLNPYISFNGDARTAMEFYREVFGGELVLNTFGDIGGVVDGDASKIMHGMLEAPNGFTLMGADAPPGMTMTTGDNISISLSGDDTEELRGYWTKLSEAGNVTVPLERQMWGDVFGSCVDRFGISWIVNISEPQA